MRRGQIKSLTSWFKKNRVPILLLSLILTGGSWLIWAWKNQSANDSEIYSSEEIEALRKLQEDNNQLQSELIAVKDELLSIKDKEIVESEQGRVAGVHDEIIQSESSLGDLVNINTASQVDLETLPGIGPSKAQAIIDYRIKAGDFKSKTELMNVKGIGQATYDNLSELISI